MAEPSLGSVPYWLDMAVADIEQARHIAVHAMQSNRNPIGGTAYERELADRLERAHRAAEEALQWAVDAGPERPEQPEGADGAAKEETA